MSVAVPQFSVTLSVLLEERHRKRQRYGEVLTQLDLKVDEDFVRLSSSCQLVSELVGDRAYYFGM